MARLRGKQKEDRQRRILEAAGQQFRKANYRDVTIEAIAEEAGLSAMTVFNYYGSKGDYCCPWWRKVIATRFEK